MAILAFQKPEKVIMLESTSSFGRFEFRPLEPGFGMTVGNARQKSATHCAAFFFLRWKGMRSRR